MADDVTVKAGTTGNDVPVAADETASGGHTAGTLMQLMKLAVSADGDSTHLPADAANGLDVDVTRIVPGTTATSLGKAEDIGHNSGDTGIAVWGVRNDNAATTWGADQDYAPFAVDLKGRQLVRPLTSTGTTTSVAASASSVTLLSANSNRQGSVITNDSTVIMYLKCGATASSSSYTYKLQPDGVAEIPFGYTGVIDAIWASATGNARITEFS